MVTGPGSDEGVVGVDGDDVIDSLSDIGAVMVVVVDALSGSMMVDGCTNRPLGWA